VIRHGRRHPVGGSLRLTTRPQPFMHRLRSFSTRRLRIDHTPDRAHRRRRVREVVTPSIWDDGVLKVC
jgi:hypothetical protein